MQVKWKVAKEKWRLFWAVYLQHHQKQMCATVQTDAKPQPNSKFPLLLSNQSHFSLMLITTKLTLFLPQGSCELTTRLNGLSFFLFFFFLPSASLICKLMQQGAPKNLIRTSVLWGKPVVKVWSFLFSIVLMNVSTDRLRIQSNIILNQFYSLPFFPRICRRLVAKLKILQFLSKVI